MYIYLRQEALYTRLDMILYLQLRIVMFGQVHTDWEKDCRHDYDERLNYVELLHRYIGAKVVKVRGYVSGHVAPT